VPAQSAVDHCIKLACYLLSLMPLMVYEDYRCVLSSISWVFAAVS
jgi:hypothetical protein